MAKIDAESFAKGFRQSLTPKQKDVFDKILNFNNSHAYSPTLQEVAGMIGKSLPTAQHHVGELVRKGYLPKIKNKTRGILVMKGGDKNE